MSSRSILFALTVLAICTSMAAFTAAQTDSANPENQLGALLTERRDTLRARVEAIESRYIQGTMHIDKVIAAKNDLLKAELELTDNPVERVALRESMVVNMKQIEESARVQLASGTGATQDVLAATADRLQAEIDLLRERGN